MEDQVERTRIGRYADLERAGVLIGKLGSLPVCVFLADGSCYAVEDRCPHMGFPLHRGSVESGILTCHWHHARFDLESGGTFDPFADDVRAHDVVVEDGDVFVVLRPFADEATRLTRRLEEGLEQGLTLVLAKSVLGLFDALGPEDGTSTIVSTAVRFGLANRSAGWGAGLTVLVAMANVLPVLDERDRTLALVHGLRFLSDDTRGRPPRFPLEPLDRPIPADRLTEWYRRFVETRNGDAAERVLATAAASAEPADLVALMVAATTDHLFLDGGHTIDFTNKAFEALDHVGWNHAGEVLTSLAQQTARAARSEEAGEWRHPDDLTQLLAGRRPIPMTTLEHSHVELTGSDVDELVTSLLAEDPNAVVAALEGAQERGLSVTQLAQVVAYAAALRMVRFHTQNDHGDWDVVHHAFTSANALHQLAIRAPSGGAVEGLYQSALRVYLDRFLNVPAARLPSASSTGNQAGGLDALQRCWDTEGCVDEAGDLVYQWLRAGGDRVTVLSALGSALLEEDAEFHWYQTFEAAFRQATSWPEGSEPSAMILVGAARFLAAHTPTRRELSQVVRLAGRLRRGDSLFDEA
jgi:nitrite reductase/ring-hydroxylating ferredoxin subunit